MRKTLTLARLKVIVGPFKRSLERKTSALVRSWSPWHLRNALSTLKQWMDEDRMLGSTDWENTSTEVAYRFARNTLRGMPCDEAHDDAERYSIKGGTLRIDGAGRR